MGYLQDYRIASGSNIALGSLVNIESITATGDTRKFYSPKSIGFYNPGERRTTLAGRDYFAGYANTKWVFDVMTRNQLAYLRTTYCAGGWDGLVTIYTATDSGTYLRYNAVMRLQKPADNGQGEFFAYKRFELSMTRMVLSS